MKTCISLSFSLSLSFRMDNGKIYMAKLLRRIFFHFFPKIAGVFFANLFNSSSAWARSGNCRIFSSHVLRRSAGRSSRHCSRMQFHQEFHAEFVVPRRCQTQARITGMIFQRSLTRRQPYSAEFDEKTR